MTRALERFDSMAIAVEENYLMTSPTGTSAETAADTHDPMSRWVLVALGVVYLAVAFSQRWGLIVDDTKLPLVISPVRYMASVLHLWDESTFGGTVHQIGFVFPMDLFFGLGHLLHIPVWCTERLWLASLLTVACWGIVRLCEALGIGTRWARVLAGLAYCAAPIAVTWAQTSADLLAVVFIPWMLLPLVIGSREGSPRRAAARSGVAVALMGGGNAAVILATIPVAVIWFVTRQRSKRRRTLLIWWLISLGLACFWWAVTIVIFGKYGFNYLPYTETAATTTSTSSLFESIRGASYWLDYFTVGGPLLPGAWTIVSSPVVIVGSAIVAALGLAGLCRRIPERLFLVTCLAFGIIAIAAGYSGPLGGPFSDAVQHLLRTSLGPFRNISKFSPDVTLPLVLGLAWSCSSPIWGTAKRKLYAGSKKAWKWIPELSVSLLVKAVAIAAVVTAAAPFWQGTLYKSGGFTQIPTYWSQAGQWLDHHQGHENALLVPGSNLGSYSWGSPDDEPLQVLGDTSVFWRNIIPLASTGYIQMLDAVEGVIDDGTATPGLTEYLSRGGIKYVVERNDLNLSVSGAPPPAEVHQVLSETAGLKEVASFGPIVSAQQVEHGTLPVYDTSSDLHLRSVEIFRVDAPTSIVHTYPVADPVVVSGDVGSLLPLAGVVAKRAAVLAGDPKARGVAGTELATWAITDGNQRRATGFGGIRDNTSYLLSGNQKLKTEQPGVPLRFIVVPGAQHQTVSSPIDAASVSASSFGSSLLVDDPSEGPASAFDGDPYTSWVANANHDSVGQWVAITLRHRVDISAITITPSVRPSQPTVSRIKISTDQGSVTRDLPATTKPVRLSVARGLTLHLRVTIEAVRSVGIPLGAFPLGAGISDIAIPGVKFMPRMKVPNDESAVFSSSRSSPPVVSFSRPLGNANLDLGQPETDDANMARVFVLPKSMTARASGYVVPRPGLGLEELLEKLTPQPSASVQVTASSWLGFLPRFRPQNLEDPSQLPWIASVDDKSPSVKLKWSYPDTIHSISLLLSPSASRPTKISIAGSTGGPVSVKVPKDGGTISFKPIVTNSLTIKILAVAPMVGLSPSEGVEMTEPVGLLAIGVLGLYVANAPNPDQHFSLPCGQGPQVTIDGTSIPTTVSGTVADLLDFRPLQFTACTGLGGTRLSAGSHNFSTTSSTAPFEVTSVTLQEAQRIPRASTATRTVGIGNWNSHSRTISVGAGPATYVVVSQNYNPGWVAKMGSHTLAPVRIDGWQQGYIVPAGARGTITLVMAPDSLFRWVLIIGAALLLGLAVLALWPSRRRPPDASRPRSMPSFWLLLLGSVAVLTVVAGPFCLLVLPLLWIARRWGTGALAATALVAFAAAGIAAALDPPTLHGTGAGAFGGPAQAASAIALAPVLVAIVVEGRRSRRHERHHEPIEAAPLGVRRPSGVRR